MRPWPRAGATPAGGTAHPRPSPLTVLPSRIPLSAGNAHRTFADPPRCAPKGVADPSARPCRAARPGGRAGLLRGAPPAAASCGSPLRARLRAGPPGLAQPPGPERLPAPGAHPRGWRLPAEEVPLSRMARFEEDRDWRGLATAHLLRGEYSQAKRALERLPRTADVENDLALATWGHGNVSAALAATERALELEPNHVQALWNRALLLKELGLTLASASTFERVAALAGPGWREEARDAAAAQRSALKAREASWEEAQRHGLAMVERGTPVPDDVARRFPGLTRLYFYDAVRTAPTVRALASLQPLAQLLDSLSSGQVLHKHLKDVAARWRPERRGLAERYRALVLHRDAVSGSERAELLTQVLRSGQPDLVLGTLLQTGELPRHLAAYRRAVKAARDPWFQLLLATEEGKAERLADRPWAVERQLRQGLASCGESLGYRCGLLELELADLLRALHRYSEAEALVAGGVARARAMGEWALELRLLFQQEEVARFREDFPRARAFLVETALRQPHDCGLQGALHELRASMRVARLEVGSAREEMRAADAACGREPSIQGALTRTDLARLTGDVDQARRAREELNEVRARGNLTPGERLTVAQVEGRLKLQDDAPAGRALLREIISGSRRLPPEDVDAHRARSAAYSQLVLEAGKRGAWDEVLSLLGEELGARAVSGCLVGLALEDEQWLWLVRGQDGRLTGQWQRRASDEVVPQRLVPAPQKQALRACPHVEVWALPPLHGLPNVLPPEVAWSYRGPGEPTPLPWTAPRRRLVVRQVELPPDLKLPPLGARCGRRGSRRTWSSRAARPPLPACWPSWLPPRRWSCTCTAGWTRAFRTPPGWRWRRSRTAATRSPPRTSVASAFEEPPWSSWAPATPRTRPCDFTKRGACPSRCSRRVPAPWWRPRTRCRMGRHRTSSTRSRRVSGAVSPLPWRCETSAWRASRAAAARGSAPFCFSSNPCRKRRT